MNRKHLPLFIIYLVKICIHQSLQSSVTMERPMKMRKVEPNEIDCVLNERKDIINTLNRTDYQQLRELLVHAVSFPFKPHRDNFYDKIAILDCALEIVTAKCKHEKNCIEWCHRIQNYISNDDIREGWKVSFSFFKKAQFYYLNDKLKQRKIISFMSKCTY